MHISILDGSPHWIPPQQAARTEVYLDGVHLLRCVEADDETGTVVVGERVGDQYVLRTRHGTVEIRVTPRA